MTEVAVNPQEVKAATPAATGGTENAAKPGIRELLKQSAERGTVNQEAARGKWRERFSNAREAVKNTWNKTREAGKTTDAMVRGLANNPDLRAGIADVVRTRIEDAREAGRQKADAISQAAADKRDATIESFRSTIKDGRDAIADHVLKPSVEAATKVKDTVVGKAAEGMLFGIFKTAQAVEAGTNAVDTAKNKATEWGNKLTSFMRRQGERVSNGYQASKDTVVGTYYTGKAVAEGAGRSVGAAATELQGRRAEKSAERAQRKAEASERASRAKRERATELRGRAAALRTGGGRHRAA